MKKTGAVRLTVSIFKEGQHFIAYCPSLDLSAYGNSFDDVRKAFAETLDIFFEELVKKGTLEEVLTDCGWKQVGKSQATGPQKRQSRWAPPSFITNIQEEYTLPV